MLVLIIIINIADETMTRSVEATSKRGVKLFTPSPMKPFVSTNLFNNRTWILDTPTEKQSWNSLRRRDNIVTLLTARELYTVRDVQSLMDIRLSSGGARWEKTLYQVIYDFASQALYIRTIKHERIWQKFDMHAIFNTHQEEESGIGIERLILAGIFICCVLLFVILFVATLSIFCWRMFFKSETKTPP